MNYEKDILKPIRKLKNPFINEFEKHNKQKEFQLFERTSLFNKKHKQTLGNYNNGIRLISKGKYDKAKLILQNILDEEKSFFPAWLNLGLIYSKLGELNKALECYNYAISFNQDYDIAYFNRGILYEKLGEFQQAINDYQSTVDVNPLFHKARASIYLLLLQMDETEKAKNILKEMTKLIQDSPYIYFLNYENSLNDFDYNNAYSWLKKSKPFFPQNGDFFYNLGWLAYYSKDLSESIKYYEIALKFRPTDLESVYNLSIIKIKAGFETDGIALFSNFIDRKYKVTEVSKRLEHWEKLGEIFPELPDIHMVIAEQYYSIGNVDRTLDILKKMKTLFRDHLTSRVFLAEILYDLGEYGESIKEWQNIILEFNDYLNAYNKLGQIYAMLGNMTSAITIWKKAEEKFPENSEFKYQLSLAYATEKDFDKALEYIYEAKKLNSTSRKIIKRYKEIKTMVDNAKKRNFY